MPEADILQQTQHFVRTALSKIQSPATRIFSIQHTEILVNTAQEIGREMQLTEKEQRIVTVAAWLHGLEHSTGISSGDKEPVSNFLISQGVALEEARQIMGCIQAATPSASPNTLIEEIFCDALTSYIADADYPERMLLLKREVETTLGKPVSHAVWITDIINFFTRHRFYTSVARQQYGGGKEKNLQVFAHQLPKLNAQSQEEPLVNQPEKLKQKKEKTKEQKAGRGIETMFRTTMASHLQLSVMADNKANLMISINAIIVSIILSSFVRNFEEMPHLVIPTVLLTVVCLCTIVFALLSTKPTIKIKKTEAPETRKLDLLFFGDFTEIPVHTYREGIKEMMTDPDRLYNGMIDNIYAQGKVISKKYRLLKIAYTFFMIGFILVVLSYAIALILHET